MPPLDLEMETGKGLNGIPGWSVGVLEGITMSYKVKKVILPTYNLHTAFSPSARFVAKVAYFQTPYTWVKTTSLDQMSIIPGFHI